MPSHSLPPLKTQSSFPLLVTSLILRCYISPSSNQVLITPLSYSSLNVPMCMQEANVNKLLSLINLSVISIIYKAPAGEPRSTEGRVFPLLQILSFLPWILHHTMSRKKCGRVDCPQKLGYSWAEGKLGQKCWDPHWQIKGADKLANSQVLIHVAMVTLGLVRVSLYLDHLSSPLLLHLDKIRRSTDKIS